MLRLDSVALANQQGRDAARIDRVIFPRAAAIMRARANQSLEHYTDRIRGEADSCYNRLYLGARCRRTSPSCQLGSGSLALGSRSARLKAGHHVNQVSTTRSGALEAQPFPGRVADVAEADEPETADSRKA